MAFRSQIFSVLGSLAVAVILVGSCKTFQDVSGVKSDAVKSPQCRPGGAFKGSCQVVEVTGRLGVTTEAARASFVGEVAEVRFNVPEGDKDAHADARFVRKTGVMEELAVTSALDLYGRQGCLAEINGGVVGDGFTPRVTLHALFSSQDEARSGYAEVSDYRTGKTMHATLGLKCEWQ